MREGDGASFAPTMVHEMLHRAEGDRPRAAAAQINVLFLGSATFCSEHA